MKKMILLATMAAVMTACTNDAGEYLTTETPQPTEVTLTFSPYEMEAMTRAQAVSDFANKLDLWLYSDGTLQQQIQQEADQPGFGTLALTLDKRLTYTLYAVAHKSSGGHATLQDGIIAWPSDKISQTFFYTRTFSPADVTTLSCQMDRIVALFRLETTDPLPADATRATIDVPQSFTAWSTAALAAIAPKDRTVTFSTLAPAQDGTVVLSAYLLSTADAPTPHTVTVTFQDAAGQPVQQRTFHDVPLRNGYRTTYRGAFFTDAPFTSTFTVDAWQDYDVTEF
ncbi:MAG: hypothetical protein IJV24_07080 [Prevotella sp.]|nr:hypothetical protein [Prevotella sp.]